MKNKWEKKCGISDNMNKSTHLDHRSDSIQGTDYIATPIQ